MSTHRILEGRIAWITGAGQGIGEAIAIVLAERGATCVVTDVDDANAKRTSRTILDAGNHATSLALDVSDRRQVDAVFDTILGRYDRVDILVNNAGILAPTCFENIPCDEWARIMDVNVTGTFHCCQAVFNQMKRQGQGRIVNIASIAGRSTSDLGGAHYTTSKAAVLGLTRHVAKEGGPAITANAVCPGMIDTPLNTKFGTPEKVAEVLGQLALERIGAAREIATVVAFLASDDASYITGETIEVDGGALMI